MAEAYLEKHPGDGYIWALYGDTLRSLGRFAEAGMTLLTARGLLESDDNKAYINRLMGDLCMELGDYGGRRGLVS